MFVALGRWLEHTAKVTIIIKKEKKKEINFDNLG